MGSRLACRSQCLRVLAIDKVSTRVTNVHFQSDTQPATQYSRINAVPIDHAGRHYAHTAGLCSSRNCKGTPEVSGSTHWCVCAPVPGLYHPARKWIYRIYHHEHAELFRCHLQHQMPALPALRNAHRSIHDTLSDDIRTDLSAPRLSSFLTTFRVHAQASRPAWTSALLLLSFLHEPLLLHITEICYWFDPSHHAPAFVPSA